jgi:S-adenosylmethionine synthetase
MPLALDLSHKLLIELAALRRENNEIKYLRPDSKSQVTIEYSDDNKPEKIDAIVFLLNMMILIRKKVMLAKIKKDIVEILIPRVN